jgi:hypothetical protein
MKRMRIAVWGVVFCSSAILCSSSTAQWTPTVWKQSTNYLLATDSILYACTQQYGIVASTDESLTWTALNNGLLFETVISLSRNRSFLFAGTYQGLFRSGSGGLQWTFASSGLGAGRIGSILAEDTLVLASTSGSGVFASRDNGTNWDSSSGGLRSLYVNALVRVRELVFAGTRDGVYRSDNNGLTWLRTSQGMTDSVVLKLTARDTVLFSGTERGGIFRSTDLGATWEQKNVGIDNPPGGIQIFGLGTDGKNVFASALAPVYLSRDDGDSWGNRSEGLPSVSWANFTSLVVQGQWLYIATGDGVYRRPHEEITGVNSGGEEIPTTARLYQNYPNPFNPSTTIKYELPKTSNVRLSVCDLLGREVTELLNERREAGAHEVKFDASALSSGMYFYRLQAGEFVQTRKLLLVR